MKKSQNLLQIVENPEELIYARMPSVFIQWRSQPVTSGVVLKKSPMASEMLIPKNVVHGFWSQGRKMQH